MPMTAVVTGIILILIGIVGYIAGDADKRSLTALIPSAFGLIIAILGFAASASENLRKHLMHAAVLVALLGFVIPTGRLASKFSELTFTLPVIMQGLMALVCLFFVILAIQSFVNARRNPA